MPCAESTVQDKRSPDVRTRDPLTKSKLREKSRENSREVWKTSLFSTATKAIRKETVQADGKPLQGASLMIQKRNVLGQGPLIIPSVLSFPAESVLPH